MGDCNVNIKPDVLKVVNEDTNEVYCGCDQIWFPTEWQRLSGCGPSVASNIENVL